MIDNSAESEENHAMNIDRSLVTGLIEAAMSADYTGVRRVGGAIARQLAAENDLDGAKAIQSILRKRGMPLQASGYAEALPRDAASRLPLVEEGQWPSTPAILPDKPGLAISQFIEDAKHIDLFSKEGVSARLALLLHGPPGTGKSLIAGHVAGALSMPFYVVRLDSLISSRLGETAKNIRGVFDYVPSRQAVLFLDEMDAIAKVRDDRHEHGELKRVVNTVLQGLDALPDDVITVAATNHPHLLDAAIWRRFPYEVEIGLPDYEARQGLWHHFLYRGDDGKQKDIDLLARVSDELSGADIENIALAARRRAILSDGDTRLSSILLAVEGSRMGSPRMISDQDLDSSAKKSLSVFLSKKGGIRNSEIARIVGVSRQMVGEYLKGSKNA